MNWSTLTFPVLHCLLESAHPHVHWVSDVIQLSHLLLPPSPPALNLPQQQGLFQWVHSLHQVARVLELQLQHQSFREYSRLVSFRIDWLDLLGLVGQGSLKNLLQHHNSKASILQRSPFFVVQLSHPQTLTVPNAGEDAEQKKLSFSAGGKAKWYSHFGRQTISYKTKHSGTIYQSCILIFTQRNWKHVNIKTCPQIFLTALFVIAKTWKQSRCPWWMTKLWYI